MEKVGWILVRICFSLIALMIFIAIATLIYRMISTKLRNHRERKKEKAEEEKLLGILAQWDPAAVSIFKDIPAESDIYYLDCAKILRKYPLPTFCDFVFPESDKPPFWIIETNEAPNYIPCSHTALVYNNPSMTRWHIVQMENAFKSESGLENRCCLADRLGHMVAIQTSKKDTLYTDILLLAQKYESRADIWEEILQREAGPILLATKDSMGESPNIEYVRKLIEGGPKKLSEKPIPNSLLQITN